MPYKINKDGVLADHATAMSIVAVLVKRLGGEVFITQADVDAVAGSGLYENPGSGDDRSLLLTYVPPERKMM